MAAARKTKNAVTKAPTWRPPAKSQGKALRTVDAEDEDEDSSDRSVRAFQSILSELEDEARERVADRADLELRWEQDLRQYHGRYGAEMEARLKREKKSRLFVNITRKRTHGWEARLSDMLFPSDDKNWGISPTPLPTIAKNASAALKKAQFYADRANTMRQTGNVEGEAKALNDGAPWAKKHQEAMAIMDEAKERAEAMEKLIEDQFVEAQYAIKVRQAIHDACKIGTGIIKGPMISSKVKRKFTRDEHNPKLWRMSIVQEKQVEWQRVNYYNFFPDMTVPDINSGSSTYQRWLPNRKELRAMMRTHGFNEAAVRRLLKDGPATETPQYLANLRAIQTTGTYDLSDCYTVWEWHGILDKEKLETMAAAMNDPMSKGMLKDLEIDELDELPVILWFCQGEVLKYGPHPLDSGDSMYSTFVFEKDETCPFGFGVPYLMRDSQSALNGAWRMIMDHGNVTTGPQIVFDPDQVEPEDGQRRITGNKLWRRTSNDKNKAPAFEVFQINDNQSQLQAIVEMARDFADEEAIMPLIAQGDQGTHTTQTKGGMAILMNASNVVFRRVVKNFDDDMTVPNLRRQYEFNMLHSEREEVKGDANVDARGSSVLLVREMQAQNLMAMALQFTNHPVLGPLTKSAELYRRLVQAHNLPVNDIVKTDDEISREEADKQANPPPDPEQIKLDKAIELEKLKGQNSIMVVREQRITEMMKVAQMHNMKREEIQAWLYEVHLMDQTEQRLFAADAALTDQRDRRAASIELKTDGKAGPSPLPSSTGTPRAAGPAKVRTGATPPPKGPSNRPASVRA